MKQKLFIFYFLSLTWGSLLSIIGLLTACILWICGKKVKVINGEIFVEVGYEWGGLNLGIVSIVCKDSNDQINSHEYGHSLQNLVLGPFMPFIICFPSVIRYWLYEFAKRSKTFEYLLSLLFFQAELLLISIQCVVFNLFSFYIVFISISIYLSCINIWLIFFESKKFFNKCLPKYDSIWFENSATMLGKKYYKGE